MSGPVDTSYPGEEGRDRERHTHMASNYDSAPNGDYTCIPKGSVVDCIPPDDAVCNHPACVMPVKVEGRFYIQEKKSKAGELGGGRQHQ